MTAACPRFGFRVTAEAADDPADVGRVIDELATFLESRGLCFDRTGGASRVDLVVSSEASQATHDDRLAVRAWLESHQEVRATHVGELADLDHAG